MELCLQQLFCKFDAPVLGEFFLIFYSHLHIDFLLQAVLKSLIDFIMRLLRFLPVKSVYELSDVLRKVYRYMLFEK